MGIRNLIFNKFKFPTKGRVDPRIIEKQVLVREKIEKAREEGRYCFFESPYAQVFLSKTIKDNDYERYETFYNMIDSWDSVCHLSLETGQYASNLWLSDTSKVPAIHRTYLSGYTNQIISINSNRFSIDDFNKCNVLEIEVSNNTLKSFGRNKNIINEILDLN